MSERGFSGTIETALAAARADLALLVELAFVGGTERFWTGVGDIAWNSQTWTGSGELGSIDKIADSVEKSDAGVELTLNYLDDDIRNELVTNDSVGQSASIYLALFDIDAGTVTDAYELYAGFIDQIEIVDAGETGEVHVRLASELARLKKPQFMKLTDAHQQYLFAGDVGLEFASRMDQAITWGRKPVDLRTNATVSTPATSPNPTIERPYWP